MFQIAGGQANGYSVTPGILLKLGKGKEAGITVGLKVDEMVNSQSWGTGAIEQVPPKLRLGIAYKSPNPGLFAIDISQTIRSSYAPEVSGGYEYAHNGLSVRLGCGEGGITAGAGFAVKNARVDYAYVTQKALSKDNVHRISLSGIW